MASGNGAGTASARDIAPLGLNAEKVVSKRYSLRDENGEPVETWADIVRRVVGHVSKAETDPFKQKLFYNDMTTVMLAREFIPNTPCLVNAGKPKGPARRLLCSQRPRLDRGHYGARPKRRDHPPDGRRHRA